MRRILVTGGCGFIGSNFVRYALETDPNVEVVNLDKLTYAGNRENLADLETNPRYQFVQGDVADRDLVRGLLGRGFDALVHFAAESHVDRSIHDSTPFVQTNVLGTQVLLDATRQAALPRYVQVSCYDEETRVLTCEGLKHYSEVRAGEEVLSLNPETGRIEPKKVLKVIVQDYAGPMVVFQSNRIDLKVTPNHRMLYVHSRGHRPEPIDEAEAQAVAIAAGGFLPRGTWSGIDPETTPLEGIGPVATAALFYVAGVFIGGGRLATPVAEPPDRKGRLSSGRSGGVTPGAWTCYRIVFDVPESDKARARLEAGLSRLGVSWTAHRGRSGAHVSFSSPWWSRFFEQFGRSAATRHVPAWMLDYAPRYLRALLDGIVDSDGPDPGPNQPPRVSTASFRLVEDLCELGIKLGLMPRFATRPNRAPTLIQTGRLIRPRRPHYRVSFRDEWIAVNPRIASVEAYRGKVWCLKVEGNRNLIAERHGTLTFCGNTDEVYGTLGPGDPAFRETTPLAPNSPYAASKAAADLLVRSFVHTFGFPALITRCSNNYGPYQFPEKLIPLFITNALADQPVPVYGDGRQVRDWIHVRDHCRAVDLVMRQGRPGAVYNIGGGCERENIAITRTILRLLGKPESLIRHVTDRPGHDRRYAIDSTRIETELGWQPEVALDDGLRETIQWYRDHAGWVARVRSGEYRRYYALQYGSEGPGR